MTTSEGQNKDAFGYDVSLYDDYALIGAPTDDSLKGSAYIFKRESNSWKEQDKLVCNNRFYGDMFGFAVSLNDDCALIGSVEYLVQVRDQLIFLNVVEQLGLSNII